MQELLIPILFGVSAMGVYFGSSWLLARRRRSALARGEDVVFRVRLSGARAPYPEAIRRGRLSVGPSGLVWTPSFGGVPLDLSETGIRPIGVRDPRFREQGSDMDVVVTAADGMGVSLRLVGGDRAMEQLDEVLRQRGLPELPVPVKALPAAQASGWKRPSRLMAVALLVIALAGGLFTTWTFVAGVAVTATVVSEPDEDDYCTVRWTDPRDGKTKENGADCYWDVGDEVPFIALADPLFGEVVDREDPFWWAGLATFFALISGAVFGMGWWRGRRTPSIVEGQAAAAAPVQPPVLTADQLSYDEVVTATRLRAGVEGWPFDAERGATPPARSRLREGLGALASLGLPLAFALGFGLLIGWTSFAGLWASMGPTATVTATVDEAPEEFIPFAPQDLPVTFPLRGGGTSSTTLVSVVGWPEQQPKTIRVEYDLDDPDRVRALDYDGVPRGAAMSGLLALAGLGYSGYRGWQFVMVRKGEARARQSSSRRHVRYVLVPDPMEELQMLLFDGSASQRPGHAIALMDDVRGQIAAAGTVEVRGSYTAGEIVVPLVNGVELDTASRLVEIDAESVLELVNGFGEWSGR